MTFARGRVASCLFVLILSLSAFLSAQEQQLPTAKRAQIESAVSKFMASTHVPGISVAVVENGRLEWASGFGFADLENNVPATEHTLFRLASISKSLTATGAMELSSADSSIWMHRSRNTVPRSRKNRGRSQADS